MKNNIYDKEEDAFEICWNLTNFTEQFEKHFQKEINSMHGSVKNSIDKVHLLMDNEFKKINERLDSLHKIKEQVSEEEENVFETLKQIKEIEGMSVNIYNPTLDHILKVLGELITDETNTAIDKSTKYGTLREKLESTSILTLKAEKELDQLSNGLNEIIDNFKKGSTKLFEGEVLLGKIIYSLRFLDKLDPKTRNMIISANPNEISKLLSVFGKEQNIEIKKEDKESKPKIDNQLLKDLISKMNKMDNELNSLKNKDERKKGFSLFRNNT